MSTLTCHAEVIEMAALRRRTARLSGKWSFQGPGKSPYPRLQAAACMAVDATGKLTSTYVLLHGGMRDGKALGDFWRGRLGKASLTWAKQSNAAFDLHVCRAGHVIVALDMATILIIPVCGFMDREIPTHDQISWGVHMRSSGRPYLLSAHADLIRIVNSSWLFHERPSTYTAKMILATSQSFIHLNASGQLVSRMTQALLNSQFAISEGHPFSHSNAERAKLRSMEACTDDIPGAFT